jgi:hypothetical protein
MADMTGTTLATWLPEVWSRIATVTYRSNVVYNPLFDHRWEPEIGLSRGDTVNIPGFTQNSSASNRGAGTGTFGTGASITFDAVTESQVQLKVNRLYYKAWRMPIEMVGQVMAPYPTLLMDGAAQACVLQEDTDMSADGTDGVDSFTTVVGTDNVDITEDSLFTVNTNMDNQNAPAIGRAVVLSPASWASVLKIDSVRNQLYRDTLGSLQGDRTAGFMGRFLTFDFYMSNNNEAGTSGKKNAAFYKEAIAVARQMNLASLTQTNLADGIFQEHVTFMTMGFKKVVDGYGNELDGK